MNRKEYLELCQRHAIGEQGVFVEYAKSKYHPLSLSVWFNERGECQNTAVLLDLHEKSVINCRLQDIISLDKAE